MEVTLRSNSALSKALGISGTELLLHSIRSITRILPHVETFNWSIMEGKGLAQATFSNSNRRELNISINLSLGNKSWRVTGRLRRRRVPAGVGAISRTIDLRERSIAESIVQSVADMFAKVRMDEPTLAAALQSTFDERVVARHLRNYHGLAVELGPWFTDLRRLTEQSYENKAITFGCVVDVANKLDPETSCVFPRDFLRRKKFRVLSDGYRTAYAVSSRGAITGFVELSPRSAEKYHYYPEWCAGLASHCRSKRLGICLTNHGDLMVFDNGRLTFTNRLGRWQYWNHGHIVDLIANAARVQHIKPSDVSSVVRAVYRAALDVSFRRSGALFVVLHNHKNLTALVRQGDAVGDPKRTPIDEIFDRALNKMYVQFIPRSVIADLAALDGAIVLNNRGELLAFGAVLAPRRQGKVHVLEGSRTKAAIGASYYGLALMVSSDGEITVYSAGRELIKV